MTGTAGRVAVLVCVVFGVAIFFLLDLDRHLTLAAVKGVQSDLAAAFRSDPLPVAGGFIGIMVGALALSLPGAVLTLSLAGGAIFGLFWGAAFVLIAVTIGDSLAFLAARYVFRDWVQQRFGSYLGAFNRGVERDGPFYLLSLRLLAVVPYFVVNYALALTPMKLRWFAPLSFLGLIPATLLYVNAGTALAEISAPSDIYSPQLLISFGLLAVVPLVIRAALRRRRAPA